MIWLTGAIAFFGLCTVIVGFLQWNAMKGQLSEMHSGGVDTHTLAEAAKRQADKTETISNSIGQAVTALKESADSAKVQASASKTSAQLAQAAVKQSDKIWRSQQSPLVGIQNNSITFPQIQHFLYPAIAKEPTIWVGPIQYVIKNFGAGPAFHVWELVMVMPEPSGIPLNARMQMCSLKQQKRPETTEGQFLLPGAEIRGGVDSVTISPVPPEKNIERMTIMVCLSYQDAWGTVHHSRFLYRTLPSMDKPITPDPNHPDWTYRSIGGAYLKSADTDYEENPN